MKLEIERKWLFAGGIGAVALVVLAVVAWQIKSIDIPLLSDGHSVAQADSSSGSHPVAESEGSDLRRCVDLWNKPSNAGPQSSLAALVASYVSITYSATYGDKCLVTAANPELNLSAQFLESDAGPYAFDQVASGEATSLPPSVTAWNASADSEGHIGLSSSRPARD